MVALQEIKRKKTLKVNIGGIVIGGGSPIVIQSMTNTNTADVDKTVDQIIELADVGSEIVRITVNNHPAAQAVPYIKEKLLKMNYTTPLVGCFHYNGHILLNEYPETAKALDKYRINPGNVGFGEKRDKNFETMIKCAIKYDKTIRIGVNWGSLDKALAQNLMDENAKCKQPYPADYIMRKAIVLSTLTSAKNAEKIGLQPNKIVLSAKLSRVQDLLVVYRELAKHCEYPLHLGLTEAGMGLKGVVSTTAALSILLQEGIGDTIRASITPKPGNPRTEEVLLCQEVLQSLGFKDFVPQVTACPGCGRTSSSYFQKLAQEVQEFLHSSMPNWKKLYPGVESLKVAVMGCIVNGPGESKHADIGISLPGAGENPIMPVFIDGEKTHTLSGDNVAEEFKQIIKAYIEKKYR